MEIFLGLVSLVFVIVFQFTDIPVYMEKGFEWAKELQKA